MTVIQSAHSANFTNPDKEGSWLIKSTQYRVCRQSLLDFSRVIWNEKPITLVLLLWRHAQSCSGEFRWGKSRQTRLAIVRANAQACNTRPLGWVHSHNCQLWPNLKDHQVPLMPAWAGYLLFAWGRICGNQCAPNAHLITVNGCSALTPPTGHQFSLS